ncbi:unnamed protein product [Sphagnum balticum]
MMQLMPSQPTLALDHIMAGQRISVELKCSSSPLTVLQGDPELKVTDVGGVFGKGLDLAGNARTGVWAYEYWKLTIKMQNPVAASSH